MARIFKDQRDSAPIDHARNFTEGKDLIPEFNFSGGTLLLVQPKVHLDRCLHLDGMSIEDILFVAPLLHCTHSRGNKHWIATNAFQINDAALFVNDDGQSYGAFNVLCLGLGRIHRRSLVDKQLFFNSCRDPHPAVSGV